MAERFTIAPLTGNGVPIVLGDDSITSPRNIVLTPPLPKPKIVHQIFHPVRAKYAIVIARGGVIGSYSWTVTRTFATIADAVTFERDHVKQIIEACALGQFTLTYTSFGVTLVSVGALETPECTKHIGVKNDFTYTWQGTPFS